MNGGLLQSTLRELKGVTASRNLWLTFGAVVLLFAFTGPFGTMEQLRFLPRLGYWLVLHGLAWTAALIFVVIGDILLKNRLDSVFWRMMIGAILAAIPIGGITQLIDYGWFGEHATASGLATGIVLSAPLCIIFCVITYMTMSAEGQSSRSGKPEPDATHGPVQEAVPATGAMPAEPPPLLRRLKPENRGALQHLSVEDHYTLVRTSRGKELILLRFSDAVGETGTTAGRQVHRSHWVADDFVIAVNRTDGRLSLSLADGTEVPVSRTYAAAVRTRFG